MLDAMISYARNDSSEFVQNLADALNRNGISTWLDTSEIEGGATWLRRIREAIADCQVFLAVRTPAASKSRWVLRERLLALELNKPIIPILYKAGEADLELIDRQHVDFQKSFEIALLELKANILQMLSGAALSSTDQRTLELAYIGRVLAQYRIWQDLYTPMAGVAEIRNYHPAESESILTAPTLIDTAFTEIVKNEFRRDFSHDSIVGAHKYYDILLALERYKQLIILGDPGSGKTTTLWRIASDAAHKAERDKQAPLPVLIRLSELEPEQPLLAQIKSQMGGAGNAYERLLAEKRIMLLLDGLNEMSRESRVRHIEELRSIARNHQANNLVFVATSRELDYVSEIDLRLENETKITISPLERGQIQHFIHSYIKSNEKAEQLFRELHHGQMLSLAENPYMLFMLTQIFVQNGHIPENKASLFHVFVNYLLIHREKLDSKMADALQVKLAKLAYGVQVQQFGTAFTRQEALQYLEDEQSLYRAQSASILTTSDNIRFTHHLLQEYFAAHYLNLAMKDGTPASEFWDRWWGKVSVWDETAIMLAGFYKDDIMPVIRWISTANPIVVDRITREPWLHAPDYDPKHISMGWLDSTEFVTEGRLPRLEWLPINNDLMHFHIARFPVNPLQYWTFVEAEDGYLNEKWWSYAEDAWAWRLENPQLPHTFNPLTNDLLNEPGKFLAQPFCNWLSSRLGVAVSIATDEQRRIANQLLQNTGLETNVQWLIDLLVIAIKSLSERRHGGVLVIGFPMSVTRFLGKHILAQGIKIDGLITASFITTSFTPKVELGDGAMVLENNRISYAGLPLPLCAQELHPRLGYRHRAATGITEILDVLSIVVSEETGRISVARRGRLLGRLNTEQLATILQAHLTTPIPIGGTGDFRLVYSYGE